MVRRLEPEEYKPERGRNPFGYGKYTCSFTIRKIPTNPRKQLRTLGIPVISLPNPVVEKNIDSFATRVPIERMEPSTKFKVCFFKD